MVWVPWVAWEHERHGRCGRPWVRCVAWEYGRHGRYGRPWQIDHADSTIPVSGEPTRPPPPCCPPTRVFIALHALARPTLSYSCPCLMFACLPPWTSGRACSFWTELFLSTRPRLQARPGRPLGAAHRNVKAGSRSATHSVFEYERGVEVGFQRRMASTIVSSRWAPGPVLVAVVASICPRDLNVNSLHTRSG